MSFVYEQWKEEYEEWREQVACGDVSESYLRESRAQVLKVIRENYKPGERIYPSEVFRLGRQMVSGGRLVEVTTPLADSGRVGMSSGGYSVWDWSDRVKRCMDYWVRQNVLVSGVESGRNYYMLV